LHPEPGTVIRGIKDGEMILNDVGKIVEKCVSDIPAHYPHVELDKFVIMPNHVHMIITIYPDNDAVAAQDFVPLQHNFQHVIPGSISSIIRGFKTGVTKWCRKYTNIRDIWQRNYYEHVIRNEKELNKIRL
jgi:REP element-mobilizing transposase RayT